MSTLGFAFDPELSLSGLLGGFAVGSTWMAGGALLTPKVVLFFDVPASASVGTNSPRRSSRRATPTDSSAGFPP
jgi:hypothetical protein